MPSQKSEEECSEILSIVDHHLHVHKRIFPTILTKNQLCDFRKDDREKNTDTDYQEIQYSMD